MAEEARPITEALKVRATILAALVGSMWAEELVDTALFGGGLDRFGIHPRTLRGLFGIPLAPFLHSGFGHLLANTAPLVVLGFFIMLRRKRDLLFVTLASTLIGGIGVWLFGGTNTVHLGASTVVFGYLGFLLSRGIFERRFWSILGSLVVFFLYGGALFGVLPGRAGISWEGHLFGLIGGVLAAWKMAERPKTESPKTESPKTERSRVT